MEIITKVCYSCKEEKDLIDFNKDKRSKDGLQGMCKVCKKEWSAKRYKEKKEHIIATNRKWQESNKEKVNEVARNWAENNPEKVKEYRKNTYEKYKEIYRQRCVDYKANNREKIAAYNKKWIEENSAHKNHLVNKRRANKLKATPKWVDLGEIKIIYENRPEGHHVDHIVPLQGKQVCGLHVSWNLQYLTIEENLKKSNKVL